MSEPEGHNQLASATVHEAAGQIGNLDARIKPLRAGARVQGQAFTVMCAPRDNLALHHALVTAPAGSVLVCHTAGYREAGYLGDIMVSLAAQRGIAGIVIDACVRDSDELRRSPVPVFATGLSVRGTTKDPSLPMGNATTLRIGEVDVRPGDLVVGDDDGVVVVSSDRVSEVVALAEARERYEAGIRTRLAQDDETTLAIYSLPAMGGHFLAPTDG